MHHRTVYTGDNLNLWLAHRCDFYGAILVLAVSCFAVGMKDTLGAATVGLAFSNTIQMLVFYTWAVRFFAESLFSMSAVEKVCAGAVSKMGRLGLKGRAGVLVPLCCPASPPPHHLCPLPSGV